MTFADRGALWLRAHAAGERSFSKAMTDYFRSLAARIADALTNFDEITPAVVPLVFRPADEAERLRPIVRRHLSGLMALGVRQELAGIEARRDARKAADDLFSMDIPQAMLARIRQALAELEQQPYWLDLQRETEARLVEIILQGIEEGVGNYRIGMNIREHLGGKPANRRAQRIARTEVTGALNAGHQAAYDELADSGELRGKEWLTIGDSDVRQSHQALSNQVVGARENFNVGGYEAPYPGHWSLPPEHRIHCRCTTVAALFGLDD